jgi:hypothetical protein
VDGRFGGRDAAYDRRRELTSTAHAKRAVRQYGHVDRGCWCD